MYNIKKVNPQIGTVIYSWIWLISLFSWEVISVHIQFTYISNCKHTELYTRICVYAQNGHVSVDVWVSLESTHRDLLMGVVESHKCNQTSTSTLCMKKQIETVWLDRLTKTVTRPHWGPTISGIMEYRHIHITHLNDCFMVQDRIFAYSAEVTWAIFKDTRTPQGPFTKTVKDLHVSIPFSLHYSEYLFDVLCKSQV